METTPKQRLASGPRTGAAASKAKRETLADLFARLDAFEAESRTLVGAR